MIRTLHVVLVVSELCASAAAVMEGYVKPLQSAAAQVSGD